MAIIEPELTEAEVLAVQAIILGKASEDQQKRGMAFIMTEFCRVTDLSFQEGNPSATDFAQGRFYVGTRIRLCLHPDYLAKAKAAEARRKAVKPTTRRGKTP